MAETPKEYVLRQKRIRAEQLQAAKRRMQQRAADQDHARLEKLIAERRAQ